MFCLFWLRFYVYLRTEVVSAHLLKSMLFESRCWRLFFTPRKYINRVLGYAKRFVNFLGMYRRKRYAYYGYHRTSTKEQHLDRGLIEIQRFCESQNIKLAGIFTDKLTGKNFDRPRYTVLVEDVLREGDTLIITELDRLGRNKQEILKQLQSLKDKGVRVMVLELPTTLIDLSQMDNALARLMIETINNVLIEIYASLAQAEMEKKEKRQREGMEAKKLRGEWDEVGRPRAIEPEKFNQEFLRVIEKEVTPTQLQRELGLTASTFYRYRKDFFEKFPQFVQFQK